MRVIRCPHCDEPLPGAANFCAVCGETLTPSPTSMTARIYARPRSLKVPRFFALDNKGEETLAFGKQSSDTVRPGQRSTRSASNRHSTQPSASILEIASIEDSRNTNWHKIVQAHPPRTPSLPRIPVSPPVPRTPLPLPADYLLAPLPARQQSSIYKKPLLFFWLSMLLLIGIVGGGLFGIAITLGRGTTAQNLSARQEIALQVMPSTVALGALITVRGTHFSPAGHIGLTRDTAIPITDTGNNSVIQVDSKGSFTDTVIVGAEWQAGPHVIRAEDALQHKSASFTILVTGHSPSLRPAHLLISATTVDLGAGDQATNSIKMLTLTNAGGGQISWQTTATQPWLLLSPKSGTFSSGESVQVTIAADRSNLQPGSYAAQALFTSNVEQIVLPVKMKTTLLEPDHHPLLQLTPAVLSFTGSDGGKNPSAQVVTVSNPGALPFQWNTSISSVDNWLSVSTPEGYVNKSGSQSVVVGVNISTLLPGRYYGVITFTGQGPATVKDSPQSVYVSLTVVPQCTLQVSPGYLSFTDVYLHASPPAKIISLNVTQGCTMPLHWNAMVTGSSWLHIATSSGKTPAYPAVSVNAAGLSPGVYTDSLLFTSTAGTQTLPVTFTMGKSTIPIMSSGPATMAFSGVVGQANPDAQTEVITNTGGGVLNWHVNASTSFGEGWLTVFPSSGSLYANESASVSVTATLLAGLTPNSYTGTLMLSGTDGSGLTVAGSPQSISVSFTVLPPCTISVSTPALSFAGVAGQSNPATKPVTITANGTCTHPLSWTATPSNSSWISTTPSSGMVGLSAGSTTNIGVILSGLSQKTYTGSITITAVDSVTHQAVGSAENIAVTLVVQRACTLEAASVANMTFSSEAGSNPAPQSFTIGITGTCTGNITITPTTTKSWLAVTPSPATITGGSATFTVKVTSATLPAGSDSNIISIVAVDSRGFTINGSPQAVNVTERVIALPSLTASPGTLAINVTTGTTVQPFSITNAGGEPLNWTAALGSDAPAMASLSATAGTGLAGGTSTSLNVIVNAAGVAGGSTFTTSVTVRATDPLTGSIVAGSPVTISVTINVVAPAMKLSSNTLSYTTTAGVNPAAQSITLTNTGGDGLTWTAGTPSRPWLTLGLTSGHNSSDTSSTISFNVDVTGMASGGYTATVVITPSAGDPVSVTVTLTINSVSQGKHKTPG